MKIGVISQWYEPEPGAAAHPTAIARALARRGHEIKVLTGFPNYPEGRIYDGFRQRVRQQENRDGISLLRVPLLPSHDSSGIRRATTLTSFAASASLQVGWLRDVDVCLVYLTPATVGAAARVLRRLAGVPYVLYVQDLWPESVTASGFIRAERVGKVAERVINAFLRGLYRHAHSTAAIAPSMRTMLVERGVRGDAAHVVYNWVDETVFRPLPPDPGRLARELDHGRLWMMYAGGLGDVQGLDTAVRAMSLLTDRDDIGLALVGDGVARPRLRELADAAGLGDSVRFLGRRPMDAMPGLMAQAAAQLVSLQDRPLFRATVPSKIQSSMASGHPIVCAVAGDAASLVVDSRAGLAPPPGDSNALAEAFRSMADAGSQGRARMAANARAYYTEHLSEAVGAARLEALLAAAAEGRVSG